MEQHKFVRFPSIFRFVLALLISTTGCTSVKQWAYEGNDRDAWQHPDRVIQALNIQPGDQIADLGSGSGYFTFRLAEATGQTGKVYAVDVDEDMNAVVVKRAKENGYTNVEIILATEHDPKLPDNGIDLVFASNSYHHLKDRITYFTNLKKDLKPNGRVALIDFKEDPASFLHGHSTSPDIMQKELTQAGYTLDQRLDFLPRQGFLIFTTNMP